ncbi:MAG: hypothetical protein ACP5JJ_19065 [Anaerolineae bacterium]
MGRWKVLAQEGDGIRISRCPGGHIHLDYGSLSLRFTEEDFRAFSAVVTRAAAALDGMPLPQGLATPVGDGATMFSKN